MQMLICNFIPRTFLPLCENSCLYPEHKMQPRLRRTLFFTEITLISSCIKLIFLSKNRYQSDLYVIPKGRALKIITYAWLKKSGKKSIKKSRKNQKSKKSRTPFFQVLYPSCYSSS